MLRYNQEKPGPWPNRKRETYGILEKDGPGRADVPGPGRAQLAFGPHISRNWRAGVRHFGRHGGRRALKGRARFQAGIAFTSKKVLQYAVILLGFGLNLSELARVGAQSLPIICATITTSLAVAFALCKCMKIPGRISVLVGVGSSICGGSAIAATAPVIGADDDEIAQAVSVIFLFNILAALLFPALGGAMGMSNEGFALFAGTAVNDTSSVTAAASTWDALHGTGGAVLARATIVKLTRTLAIIPITLALAFWQAWQAKRGGRGGGSFSLRSIFPFFILFFVWPRHHHGRPPWRA